MNELSSSTKLRTRQSALLYRLVEASSKKESSQFAYLECQWVHRYGIETLSEALEHKELLSSKESSLQGLGRGKQARPAFSKFNSSSSSESFIEVKQSSLECDVDEEFVEKSKDLNETNDSSSNPRQASLAPPPPPSLQDLRRWLPRIDEKLPKAS